MNKSFKIFICLSVVTSLLMSIAAIQKHDIPLYGLSSVEAVTSNEIDNPCGNVTFIPNEALRSAACWNGSTHFVCKSQDNVCCDPTTQTACTPLVSKE